jgi:hypothetical protein
MPFAMRISQRMISRSGETRASDREALKANSWNSDHLKWKTAKIPHGNKFDSDGS